MKKTRRIEIFDAEGVELVRIEAAIFAEQGVFGPKEKVRGEQRDLNISARGATEGEMLRAISAAALRRIADQLDAGGLGVFTLWWKPDKDKGRAA